MERRAPLEHPTPVNREPVTVDSVGHSLHKSTLQIPSNIRVYTILRNKPGEDFKLKIRRGGEEMQATVIE